jgi:hypothetical protein
MKFLQIVILAAVLVASAHAIKCATSALDGKSCPEKDLGAAADTCFKCVISGVATANSCLSTGAAATCAALKKGCEDAKGTYSDCKTDNCVTCSPASALQASAFVLVAAFVAMLF